jgi:hypothetical protein
LDAKIELGFTLESNIRFKDNELRAAKLNWNRMRSAAEPRDIAANKVVSHVTSTGKHGGADIHLRASQLPQLATTNSAKQEAEAKTELLEKLKLLVLAGIQIRSRRIGWQKTNRCQDIIFLGNTTSYLSMAAAEAFLYQKFGPMISSIHNDIESFKSMYGVGPDFVWKFRACEKFIDFLNRRADLKYYQACPSGEKTFPSSRAQRWANRILINLERYTGTFTALDLKEYFEDQTLGKGMYEKLKKEHVAVMLKRKQYVDEK